MEKEQEENSEESPVSLERLRKVGRKRWESRDEGGSGRGLSEEAEAQRYGLVGGEVLGKLAVSHHGF